LTGGPTELSDATLDPPTEPPSLKALFAAFFKIGVLGFGGVAAFARHVLVEERRFLTAQGFAELFGIGSTLPGANTVNLAIILGDRARGLPGALAAVFGLLGAPLAILVAVAALYERFGSLGVVKAGVAGAAAAAAGLVLGTSFKLLRDLGPGVATLVLVIAIAAASALLRLPMLLILAAAIPAALLLAAVRERRG
jgi:chromate transporter